MEPKNKLLGEVAQEKLRSQLDKSLRTTMIGAVASVEKHFGYLWGHDSDHELTPQELEFKELFENLRTEILDKGNSQIRGLIPIINGFEISKKTYHYNIPVRRT